MPLSLAYLGYRCEMYMMPVCVFSHRLLMHSNLMIIRMCFKGMMMLIMKTMLVRAVNFTISLHLILHCLILLLILG
jgi:hypothetical protein